MGTVTEDRTRRALVARPFVLALVLAAIVWIPGCSGSADVTWVDEDGSYTEERIDELLDEADYSDASSIPYQDAAERRREVLLAIRERPGGDAVADLLTEGFPGSTPAVPVRVERAEVQGTDAWLVWEASGEEDGALTHRRLWVFDAESGMVMHSVAAR